MKYLSEEERKAARRASAKKSYLKHRDARRAIAKKWNEANPDKVKAAQKKSRDKNKEARAATAREWYKNNKKKALARYNEYNNINKAAIAAKTSAHQKANPGIYAAKRALYDAAKADRTPNWLTKSDKDEITLIYEAAAQLKTETGVDYHVDHIIPLRGKTVSGLHVPGNLQVITAEENMSKSNSF